MKLFTLFALCAATIATPLSSLASTASKAQLQSFARKSIADSMVSGQLIYTDTEQGKTRKFVPGKNHPEIFYDSANSIYVLCITGVSSSQKEVPIDIYVHDRGGRLTLLDIQYGDIARKGLMMMMKAGQYKGV